MVEITREDLTESVRACALLADLTVSTWQAEVTDRKISNKVKEDAGAIGNTGKFIKNLLAGCDKELKDLRNAYTGARQIHKDLTLPWISNPAADHQKGPRLLPNLLFDRYLTEMSKAKREATRLLAGFVDQYPDLIVRAQANLADMAEVTDYPAVDAIANKFKLSFDFTPIPAATAFQGLPEGMLERLGSQLHARQMGAVQAAQASMWERVRETVGHLIERLEDPDKIFKVNTIESVRELVTLLPGFNTTNDPRVAPVVTAIENMLLGVDPKQLRDNQDTRADVVKQAQAINDQLASWGL
jgi:hypothetical protein